MSRSARRLRLAAKLQARVAVTDEREGHLLNMWTGAAALFALVAGLHGAAYAAASETAKADAARKKPLQRCDQLNDKAELECLHKAREGIVEARKKRENTAEKVNESSGKSPRAPEAPQKK